MKCRKKQNLIIAIVAVVLILQSAMLIAQETYDVTTTYLPELVESPNSGIFIELLNEIEQRAGIQFTVHVFPVKRCYIEFKKKQMIMVFPDIEWTDDLKELYSPPDGDPIKSVIFYMKQDFIFSRQGTIFRNLHEVQGKIVGLSRGFSYPYLDSVRNLELEYAGDDLANMKKLAAGRIDAFLVEKHSGLKAMKIAKVTNIVYDPDHPVYVQPAYFSFYPSETGRRLEQKVSTVVIKMRQDGTLSQLLGIEQASIDSWPER